MSLPKNHQSAQDPRSLFPIFSSSIMSKNYFLLAYNQTINKGHRISDLFIYSFNSYFNPWMKKNVYNWPQLKRNWESWQRHREASRESSTKFANSSKPAVPHSSQSQSKGPPPPLRSESCGRWRERSSSQVHIQSVSKALGLYSQRTLGSNHYFSPPFHYPEMSLHRLSPRPLQSLPH